VVCVNLSYNLYDKEGLVVQLVWWWYTYKQNETHNYAAGMPTSDFV